jgi:colicin import membrane protein
MVSSSVHYGCLVVTLMACHQNVLAFTPSTPSIQSFAVSRVSSNSYSNSNSALQIGNYLDSLSSSNQAPAPTQPTHQNVVTNTPPPATAANNFMTSEQTKAIETAAQSVVEARAALQKLEERAEAQVSLHKENAVAIALARKAEKAAAAARAKQAVEAQAALAQARALAAAQAKQEQRAAAKARELQEAATKVAITQARIDAARKAKEEKEAAIKERARLEAEAKVNLLKARTEAVLKRKQEAEAQAKAAAEAKEAFMQERFAAGVRAAAAKKINNGVRKEKWL